MRRLLGTFILFSLPLLLLVGSAIGWDSAAQRLYLSGGNGDWSKRSTITNIHGDLLYSAPSTGNVTGVTCIRWTMGYSTSNGKWFHFVFPAKDVDSKDTETDWHTMKTNIGSATTVNTIVQTYPIDCDGYDTITISPYVTTVASGQLTQSKIRATALESNMGIFTAEGKLTIGIIPKTSTMPPAMIADVSPEFQFINGLPQLVSIAGVEVQDVTGLISTSGMPSLSQVLTAYSGNIHAASPIQWAVPYEYKLNGARSIVLSVSGMSQLCDPDHGATTCVFVSLSKK